MRKKGIPIAVFPGYALGSYSRQLGVSDLRRAEKLLQVDGITLAADSFYG